MPILCLIALGCPKNIVECESIAGRLQAAGLRLTTDLNCADYALVHTCSFIGDARGESVATIRRLLRLKKAGRLERVFVSGCFVQAEGTAVCGMFPEVDGWIGTGDLERITELLAPGSRYIETPPGGMLESPFPRLLSSTLPSTYVRLAEGCNHRCSFCIIPRLRGKYKSRSMNAIEAEVRSLAEGGIREISLIAQDTSCYGIDRYRRYALPGLLRRLSSVRDVRWLRLMYVYPSTANGALIAAIKDGANICKYIDLPLQHVSDRVLRAMRRPANAGRVVERIKSAQPDLALRTTFIVGFPGETEGDFARLEAFVAAGWFEHMGVFEYSAYPGTAAASLPHQVPDAVKRERRKRLMLLQQDNVRRANRRRIGSVLDVLVETADRDGRCSGRAAFQAPEIDGQVLFRGNAVPGSFVRVVVTGATGYDILGVQQDAGKTRQAFRERM